MKVPEVETWFPPFQIENATPKQALELLKPSGIMLSRGLKFAGKSAPGGFLAKQGHPGTECPMLPWP